MKPMIGVTPSIDSNTGQHFINKDNMDVLVQAGANPVILPYQHNVAIIEQLSEMLDGLYLTGGNDIDPTLFNEEPHPKLGVIDPMRDSYELSLIKKMLTKNKPILAVCRGIQILNIALGGDMYQDIYAQIDRPLLQHSQRAPAAHGSHYVDIVGGSLFSQIVRKDRIKVNSRHHQANRNPGKGVIFSGFSSDGIAEVMESEQHDFVLGVQWHPENMAVNGDETSKKLYDRFVKACGSKN
jgi:putative glutamine amidotransferase